MKNYAIDEWAYDLLNLRGLRLLISLAYAVFWLIFLIVAISRLNPFWLSLGDWARLVTWFWIHHLGLLFLFLLFMLLLQGGTFRKITRILFARIKPFPSNQNTRGIFKVLSASFLIIGTVFALIAVPCAYINSFDVALMVVQLAIHPIVGLAFGYMTRDSRQDAENVPRILTARIDEMYFNSAGKAPDFPAKKRVVTRVRKANAQAGAAWELLMSGKHSATKGTSWRGVDELLKQLGNYCGVRQKGRLFLHPNTTFALVDAVRQAISRFKAQGSAFRIVMTNADYPGVHARIVQLCEELKVDPPVLLDLLSLVLGDLNADFTSFVERIPDGNVLLFIPHVHYLTGHVFPLEELLAALKFADSQPREVIAIVDGAQAVGNVTVHLFEWSDYNCVYCFSSHKWLLADVANGIAYASPVASWYKMPDNPYSVAGRDEFMGPTIDPNSLFTLSEGLAVLRTTTPEELFGHNNKLAKLFSKSAAQMTGLIATDHGYPMSGIVCVRLQDSLLEERPQLHEDLASSLRSMGVECACYDSEPKRIIAKFSSDDDYSTAIRTFCEQQERVIGLRFSFHGYHSVESVQMLLARLELALERIG